MDKKQSEKIIAVDTFRELKAEQLIKKLEYGRSDEEEFTIGMLRLGYSIEVVNVILDSVFEE
tara:strand:+ start:112 stop:297 length:186 start_codon:yes stop_codon:yes gene_type:complete